MTTFDTPTPIYADFSLQAGSARVSAGARTNTFVEVLPTDPSKEVDVQAANETRVDFSDNLLVVKAPKSMVRGMFGRTPSISIRIELPEGSEVRGDSASANITMDGLLGASSFNVASGDLRVAEASSLTVKSASGDVTAARIFENADITTASGDVRMQFIGGRAAIRTASGTVVIGEAAGELRLTTASGNLTVNRALASVTAKSASGDVSVHEAVSGTVQFDAASGNLTLGVPEGTAAWVDVKSLSGRVNQQLGAMDGPGDSAQTLKVRSRTVSGDVTVRRA